MEEHPNKTRHPLENNSAENGKKESMDKHLFPKSICYCQNESECKKLQQVFKAKLGIDTETIVNGNLKQKIQATIENFRLGKTRVLCLTEGKSVYLCHDSFFDLVVFFELPILPKPLFCS